MLETIKESKNSLKRFLERRRNIRKEMTKLGRVYDSITMMLMLIVLIIITLSIFYFGVFETGIGFLFLIFILSFLY